MELTLLGVKDKKVSINIPIFILLIISTFFNVYISIILLFFATFYIFIFKNKGKIYNDSFINIFLLYLFVIIMIGFVNIDEYGIWPFLRDLITPTITILSLYILYYLRDEYKITNDSIFKTAFVFVALSSLISIVFYELLKFQTNSVFVITRGEEFVLAIGLYLIFFKQIKINKVIFYLLSSIIILNFILAFSRSSLIVFVCLICFAISKKNIKKILLFTIFLLIFFVFVYFFYRDIFIDYFNEIINGLTEVSSLNTWGEYEITMNWRGFEIYCAKYKFSNASYFNKLFGFGAGEFIDAFGEQYRVTSEVGLPHLHNGYYTMLIKAGVFGICINLLFYFLIVYKAFKNKNPEFRLITGVTLGMLITEWVIGGPFISFKIIFILILLLNDKKEYREVVIS